MSGSERSTVIHDEGGLKVIRRKRAGSNRPAHVTIVKQHPETGEWTQGLRLNLDELFNLTEVLDDLCDAIEDETYG